MTLPSVTDLCVQQLDVAGAFLQRLYHGRRLGQQRDLRFLVGTHDDLGLLQGLGQRLHLRAQRCELSLPGTPQSDGLGGHGACTQSTVH